MHEEQAQVLIAGGGPAGLAAAIELTDNGIEPLILERRRGLGGHPRATALTAHAMQLMWRWGVADEVVRQGYPAERAMSVRTALTAPEVQRLPLTEHVWNCPQDQLEDILSVRALAGGAETRYGTELLGQRSAADAVTMIAAGPDGGRQSFRADYVIGADGPRSVVRQSSGIVAVRGQHREHWLSILFRAPLRAGLADPPDMMYRLDSPAGAESLLVPADSADRWIQHVRWHPDRGERLDDYCPERCVGLVRSAVGRPGLPVQVLSTQPFQLSSLAAGECRAGRTLLAGDAVRTWAAVTAPGLSLALQDGAAAGASVTRAEAAGQPAALDDYQPAEWQPAVSRRTPVPSTTNPLWD